MANFHDLEMSVIRHAEANKLLEYVMPHKRTDPITDTVYQLHDACVRGIPEEISDSMGRVAIDLIILCAMLDIDLSKCLEQAFAKISAKPLPSNVVFLKKE